MIRRSVTVFAVAATAITLCTVPASGAVPAAAATTAKYTAGAGYVPKLDMLGRTHMTVVVPSLPCGKNAPDSAVTVGMFGSTRTGAHTHRWQLAVRVQCHNGGRSARANFGGFKQGGGMRVHVGDVVVLTQDNTLSFGINDRTSGSGEGGSSGGGPKVHPSPRVLFGARFIGTPSKPFVVKVRNATAHGTPIGKLHPARHTQRRHGHAVARAGAIRPSHRSFAITVR